MRVVVCTDRIGALASADAGAALGRAFVAARPGTQVAVVPIASGGPDLALALAALGDASPVVRDPGAAHGHVDHLDALHLDGPALSRWLHGAVVRPPVVRRGVRLDGLATVAHLSAALLDHGTPHAAAV